MAGIWEVPPIPMFGDKSEDIIFTSVGHALTRWEEFEVLLASLFATLVGTEGDTNAAVRAYGSIVTFRGRAEMVKAAAEVHFMAYPDSNLESQFKTFMNEVMTGASARRNEIAHGVVRMAPLLIEEKGGLKMQFFLYPPYYASNKLRLDRIDTADGKQRAWYKPKYIYSSAEINRFSDGFRELMPRFAEIIGPMLTARKSVPRPSLPPTSP